MLDVRYNPADTSVTPQVLRVIAAKPDAVFVAASSTPATTPIIELRARGYAGPIYTVQGIAGPDALRVGGKALNGVMFSSVPVLVAEQIPDGNPGARARLWPTCTPMRRNTGRAAAACSGRRCGMGSCSSPPAPSRR